MSGRVMDGRWPDFLLIGAPKAGTTALYKALSRHRDIYMSSEKEPRFFAFRGARPGFKGPGGERIDSSIVISDTEYLALFADCPPGKVAGEASTAYLHSETAPAEAFACVPGARIVAVLRHPVDRGHSQWLHLTQEGLETERDFSRAWRLGRQRLADGWPPLWGYRERGFYGQQLQRWLDHYPAEQVLVLFYEEWQDQPDETLARLCRHLGIDDTLLPRVTRENVSSRQPRWKWLHHRMVGDNAVRRWAQKFLPLAVRDAVTRSVTSVNLQSGPSLDRALRDRLTLEFREDIALLERLTGADLSRWTGGKFG
jgi:hypothetical protein